MSFDHVVRDQLLVPHAVYGSAGIVLAVAGLVGYLFGRYFQQKIAVLALFAGLTLGITHFALMTGEGSDHVYGKRDDWGLTTGATIVFGLVAGQAGQFLILHDTAKVVEIGLALASGLGLVALGVAQHGSGRIVVTIVVGVIQVLCLYLGVSNMVRFDVQGWVYAILLVIAKLVVLLLAAMGPDGFETKGFSRELFIWLFGGVLFMYAVGSSVFTWFFVESEREYRTRHNLPPPEHAEGATDSVPLYVVPGQSGSA